MKEYIGPVTGHRYKLAAGEKIDVEAEEIGCTGEKSSPNAQEWRSFLIQMEKTENGGPTIDGDSIRL